MTKVRRGPRLCDGILILWFPLDLYGESAYALQPTVKGTTGALAGSDGPKALELSLMDTLPAWGNLTDFVLSINENMVRKNSVKMIHTVSHSAAPGSTPSGIGSQFWH